MTKNTAQVTLLAMHYSDGEDGLVDAKAKFLAAPPVVALGIAAWDVDAAYYYFGGEDEIVLTVPEAAAEAWEAHRIALYEERLSY